MTKQNFKRVIKQCKFVDCNELKAFISIYAVSSLSTQVSAFVDRDASARKREDRDASARKREHIEMDTSQTKIEMNKKAMLQNNILFEQIKYQFKNVNFILYD